MIERFWVEENEVVTKAHDELDGHLLEVGRPEPLTDEEAAQQALQESMWAELEALDRGDMDAVVRIRKERGEQQA